MSVEQIPEIQTPNLASLEKKTDENISANVEFIVEWVPQIEAFCERNPRAMEEFFKKFLQTETV